MNRKFRVVTAMVLGALLSVAALVGAGRLLANTLASDAVPEIVNYQGYLTDSSGNPISSTVTLVFRIYDASSGGTEVWSETHNNVQVNRGYFSVFLGSQGSPLTPSVFSSPSRYIQLTYNGTDFARQRFGSVPYALVSHQASHAITSTYATTATYALNGPSNGSGGVDWQYVVVVAKSGGDYTSITDAMNAIEPSSSSRYLVLVMPGVYTEQVTLDQYVHLKGAGKEMTFITSQANHPILIDNSNATMIVPANSQVSDLTVRNESTTNDGVALWVDAGNEDTILQNVQIETIGAGGDQHVALYLDGGSPRISHADIVVSGGASNNWGIFNSASLPKIDNSTVNASGTDAQGFRYNGGSPLIHSSIIRASGADGQGLATTGSAQLPNHAIRVEHSILIGENRAFFNNQSVNIYIGASQLDGQVDPDTNNRHYCVHTYNEDFTELDHNCQVVP